MISEILSKNLSDEKEVAWYIQSAEWEKTCQTQKLYPEKLSFKTEGEI